MDYTLSGQHVVHGPTTQRMHQDTAAVPSVWSAKDANSLLWSLMEIVKAGGKVPKQFDPADDTTYKVLLEALQTLFVSSAQLMAAAMPVGSIVLALGTNALPGTFKLNGGLINRADDPELTDYILNCGNLVDDATWLAGRRGSFSMGNGATTLRLPNIRGVFPRFFHDGDTTDPDYLTRLMGVLQLSMNQAHDHMVSTADGTNAGQNLAQTDRGVWNYNEARHTSSSGGAEARPVNLPFIGCIKRRILL